MESTIVRAILLMNLSRGRVYLVGAGPGDPGLLTLRGAECLRSADVVLYDYLASPELLSLTRPGAELVCLGRHGHGRLMSQAEINELMIRPRDRRPHRRATKRRRPRDFRPARRRTRRAPGGQRAVRNCPRRYGRPSGQQPRRDSTHPARRSVMRCLRDWPGAAWTKQTLNRSITPRSQSSPAHWSSTWALPPRAIGAALIENGKPASHAGRHRAALLASRSGNDLHDARRVEQSGSIA